MNGCFTVVTIPGYNKLSGHSLVSRFVRGIFNWHYPLPRHTNICDLNTVLLYYDNILPNKNLKFSHLCKKEVVLILIFGSRSNYNYINILCKHAWK